MKKTMQYGCVLVLALSTLPGVAQAAFTSSSSTRTSASTDGNTHSVSVSESSSDGVANTLSLSTGGFAGESQVKDDLFAGTEKFEQGASDVTNVNLDGKMLGMVGGKGKGKDGDLAHKLNFIVVHSYTYDKPGMYKMEDVAAYRKKLTDGSWNCFIHTRDKDGATDICSKTAADGETHEMVIMTAEPLELTFVHLSGKMSLDDLGKMGNNMGGDLGVPPLPPPPPRP
jgi:hypothetical protein